MCNAWKLLLTPCVLLVLLSDCNWQTHSEDPYVDTMSSRVSKRLTKHVIRQIAKKISGKLHVPFGFAEEVLETISAAAYEKKFDDHIAFSNIMMAQGFASLLNIWQTCTRHCLPMLGVTFRATILISSRSPSNSIYALCRNINTVTMPMCDILLHHFSKRCYSW